MGIVIPSTQAVPLMPRKRPIHNEQTPQESTQFNRQATKQTVPYFNVVRAKMILLAASGIDTA